MSDRTACARDDSVYFAHFEDTFTPSAIKIYYNKVQQKAIE